MPSLPPTFRHTSAKTSQQVQQEYDARRGGSRERGYTARWDKAARRFKVLHPLCLGCKAVGRLTPAALVDHILPHRGDPDRFWDQGNWQPSCVDHHSIVKQRLEQLFEKGAINQDDLRLDSAKAVELTRELLKFAERPGGD